MLVLSRKVGESILVSDNITLTVISLSGKRARVGIEAPKEVVIRRVELELGPDTRTFDEARCLPIPLPHSASG